MDDKLKLSECIRQGAGKEQRHLLPSSARELLKIIRWVPKHRTRNMFLVLPPHFLLNFLLHANHDAFARIQNTHSN